MRPAAGAALALLLLAVPLADAAPRELRLRETVETNAAAVALTADGLVGTLANVSVTVADGGSGHIFMDTFPLAEVDMQGSARLAVKHAASTVGVNPDSVDVFFVVRSGASIVGGPSAGGVLAVATLAALANLTLDRTVMMTGTINPDGTIGPVGGVPQKAAAAAEGGARVFLVPAGQEVVRERRGDTIVTVNMSEYCREELRILCRPVVDLPEAALLMTGQDFRRPPPPDEVQDETYRRVLKPKGEALLAEAEADVGAARVAFEAAANLSGPVRDALAAEMTNANVALGAAREAFAGGEYYTTASKSFQAAISARHVLWSVDLHAADDAEAWFAERRAETRAHVEDVAGRARAAPWDTLGRLLGVGAAQTKAAEAEGLLRRASVGDGLPAVYLLAYAWERADTVPWWLQIAEETPPGRPVDAARVREVARDVADAADEGLLYSRTILQEAGALPAAAEQLARADELLNASRAELAAGNVPGALLQAVEAEVRAGLALTLAGYVGEVPAAVVEAARLRSARSIADARAAGVEPVLAVSYHEFADDVDVANSLGFYATAQNAAGLEGLLAGAERRAESRFVGDARLPDLWVPRGYLLAFFALGLAVGVGACVGAVVMSRAERLTEE